MKWLAGGVVILACAFFDWHSGGTGKWFPVCLLAGLLLVRREWSLTRAHEAGLLLFLWAGSSILWSEDWRQGLHQWGLSLALLVVFLRAGELEKLLPWLVTGAVAAVLATLAFVEHAGFGNPAFLVEFLLIAAPFLALTGRYGIAVAVIAVSWLLVFNRQDIVLMAIPVLALAGAPEGWRRYVFWALVLSGLCAVVLIEPLQVSALYRLELAVNSLTLWLQAPWFGHGFGSFNAAYPAVQESVLILNLMDSPAMVAGSAHNEPVQLLVELGLIGFLIALYLVWQVLPPWKTPLHRACAWSLVMAGALSLVQFPLQNPATALLVALSLGVLAGANEVTYRVRLRPVVLVVPAVSVAVFGLTVWIGASLYGQGERFAEKGWWSAALHMHSRAATWSNDYRIRLQLPMTLDGLLQAYPQEIPDSAADAIHAHTLKKHPGVRLARLRYLKLTGRSPDEQQQIVADLKREQPFAARFILPRILGD